MDNQEIFDCHCHFVTLDDFLLYKKTSVATKFLNIRAINHSSLIKPYDFDTFKDIDNMFLTESIDLENLESELIRAEENIKKINKIIGIKIYLGYQHFYANDKRIKRVTELADKYDLSMIFHCGETYLSDDSSENIDDFADAKYIEDLAKEFKNVNFIASHMNWPRFDNLFSLCEKYENVFTCFSGCLDESDDTKRNYQISECTDIINEYLRKYPNLKNKLMYGTDFFSSDEAFVDVSGYFKIIDKLVLTDVERRNILYNNIFKAYKKLENF